ncbi:MAG TPA: response regulator [Vicinamibacterales bacterium]|nr:response regulator [Vicinamibacterales bacterium]
METSIVHVVDDDEDVRKGTARLIAAAGFKARTYASAQDFLNVIEPDSPGCVILDLRLPDYSGLDLQAALARRGVPIPIVFVSGHGAIPDSVRAIRGGAVDFLTKPVDAKALLAAVERALAQDEETRSTRDRKDELRKRYERLTARESEVFRHLIRGQLNKQVAADLQITERTIKLHRANLLQKLEVGSMAELVRLAVDLGIDSDG